MPKTIYFTCDFNVGVPIDVEIDWSFISGYNYKGVGSVKELVLDLDRHVNEIQTGFGHGPLWCYLTDKVKIEQLTIIGFGSDYALKNYRLFLRKLKADCLKVQYSFAGQNITQREIKWLRTFKTLHIVYDIRACFSALIDTINTIEHPNVHFVIESVGYLFYGVYQHKFGLRKAILLEQKCRYYWSYNDYTNIMKNMVTAIESLPDSIIKTMICPDLPSYPSGSDPSVCDPRFGMKGINETVFVCDGTLSEKWYQFMDEIMTTLDSID